MIIIIDNHDDDNHRSIDGGNDGSDDNVDNNDDVNYAFNNFVNYDVKNSNNDDLATNIQITLHIQIDLSSWFAIVKWSQMLLGCLCHLPIILLLFMKSRVWIIVHEIK